MQNQDLTTLAVSAHAHHPICHAIAKQANQEDAALLLGVSGIQLRLSSLIRADGTRICPKLDDAGKLKQEMILVWYVGSPCRCCQMSS